MAFYNIDLETQGTNADVVLRITECDAAGASSPRANYEFKIYRNPILAYTPATAAAGASFRLVSQEGERSPILTMDNVIEVNGSAHGESTTEALATAIKDLIIT